MLPPPATATSQGKNKILFPRHVVPRSGLLSALDKQENEHFGWLARITFCSISDVYIITQGKKGISWKGVFSAPKCKLSRTLDEVLVWCHVCTSLFHALTWWKYWVTFHLINIECSWQVQQPCYTLQDCNYCLSNSCCYRRTFVFTFYCFVLLLESPVCSIYSVWLFFFRHSPSRNKQAVFSDK